MTITLIVIVLVLAVFLGWLLRQTINVRPWVPAGASAPPLVDRLPAVFTTPRVGLIVFLAAISSLFALTISAYHGRMQMAGDWISVPVPVLLWINSAVLVLASIAFHVSWRAAAGGDRKRLKSGLIAAGVFSIGFVLGQAMVWRTLNAEGFSLGSNPANSFFYFITALHVLHLVGGLIAWATAMIGTLRGTDGGKVERTVELCAIYWHYLLFIWLVLFGLILST